MARVNLVIRVKNLVSESEAAMLALPTILPLPTVSILIIEPFMTYAMEVSMQLSG